MSYRILPENVRLAIMSDVFEALEVYGLASQSFQKSEEKNIRLVVLDELLSGEQSIDELLRVTLQKHEKIERVFGPLIAFIEKRIEEQLFLRWFKESINQFNELNQKIETLNNVIREIEGRIINTKYELKNFIVELQKRYAEKADKIYISLNEMLKQVNQNHEEFTSDEIIKIKNDLLREIRSQKDEIEKEKIIDAVKPLMKDTIQYELKDKGRLIQILREELTRISTSEDKQLQKIFIDIVESLMGRGVKDAKLAREAVESGVKSMSDNEVEDVFGRVFKIAESKSGTGKAIADFARKINIFEKGANKTKNFFDGFSFTIYYYICITGTGQSSTCKEFLPSNWVQSKKFYADKFEEKIIPFEEKRTRSPEQYEYFVRVSQLIIEEGDSESREVSCFISYCKDTRLYVFMNQEPSEYFKKQVENIIKSPKGVIEQLDELTANYTVPKVQLAVFNRDNFLLPTNDSVVAIRDGEKSLSDKEETELLNILQKKIQEKFKIKSNFFKLFKRLFISDKVDFFYEDNDRWFIWATDHPNKKYLAIKMQESDSKLSDQPKIKEAFITNIEAEVWKNLKNSRSMDEMQDWVDMFIRKDAGILSENIKWVSTLRQAWSAIPYLFIILAILYVSYLLIPKVKSDIENSSLQSELRLEAQSRDLGNRSSRLEVQVNYLSEEFRKSLAEKERRRIEAEEQLLKYCAPPFEFDKNAKELSDDNKSSLNQIAKNLIYLRTIKAEWKIEIRPYNNKIGYENLNRERSEVVQNFLFDQGVPHNLVTIGAMITNEQKAGFKIDCIRIK